MFVIKACRYEEAAKYYKHKRKHVKHYRCFGESLATNGIKNKKERYPFLLPK